VSTDTIVAVASASGHGGIGIVRISGSRAFDIARQLSRKRICPKQIQRAAFRDKQQQIIDSGLILSFQNPASYTGEDVIELHAHGSPIILSHLVERCIELGARPARAGEFTERAFLNNKLDLAQAEAVADLIASTSRAQARAAQRSLQGEFSNQITDLLNDLTNLRIHVEAAIDFPEEEIDFLADGQILKKLNDLLHKVEHTLQAAEQGQRLRDGLHVVILGKPNVGKSSLLNALAATDRAIVTAIAGTTRDLLREHIQLSGLAVTLVDTAGLRQSTDPIEQEGIRRAKAELAHADLALLMLDASAALADQKSDEQELDLQCPAQIRRIWVYNKIDQIQMPLNESTCVDSGTSQVWISAQRGVGLDKLRAEIEATIAPAAEGQFSARVRHVQALQAVLTAMNLGKKALLEQKAGELLAEELRQAQLALAQITGSFSADDLLGAIFSSFCIGK
jgi:tRNA modification GTPase